MATKGPIYEAVGARELRRTLRQAGDDLTDLKAAHKQASDIAAGGVRTVTPRGETGKLLATVRSAGTKTAGIIRVGNNSKTRYAGPIHWGWGRRNIAANPFASRGARATEPTWRPVYEERIEDTLEKIKGA